MTVSTTTSRADYTGNGVTTTFTVPFYFLDNSHLLVMRTVIATGVSTTLVLGSDYTVTGAGVSSGGSIACTVAPTAAQTISILRNVPLTQLTHYVENDPFPAASHERALDQLTMEVQQINETVSRAITLPPATSGVSTSLPTAQPNQLLAFNSAGTAITTINPADVLTVAGSSGFSTQAFSGNGATTAFTLSASPGAIANLEVFISGVRQRPTTDYTLSGNSLTFVAAPASGTNNILTRWGTTLGIGIPSDTSVSTVKLADAAVTTTKIADGTVTPAKLSTTGLTWNANAALGIGTALSTWIADRSVVQLGNTSALYNAGAYTYLTNNLYVDVGNVTRYIQANFAAMYQIADDGTHNFYTSPSGTANAQVTVLNRVLGIDTSGNLLMLGALRSPNTSPPVFQNNAGTEVGQLCRAWVNFNGVTTATIRASFNVSSVTRNGTGDYTINMTNALADANWVLVGTRDCETGNTQSVTVQVVGAQTKTASAARIYTLGTTASTYDSATVHVAIFR